mmetsp:Transcript_40038/g.115113  ORF Transcript_40038/g.115113 Transcript_40038/m.115113 type:complete len:205 (-) Transcript_40038:138-752(-)
MALQLAIQWDMDVEGVTRYGIRVSEGLRSWIVEKRYRDFVALDAELARWPSMRRAPLPAKGVLGLRHHLNLGRFNEQRLRQLDKYLATLAAQVETSRDAPPPLAAFLSPDTLLNSPGPAAGELWATASMPSTSRRGVCRNAGSGAGCLGVATVEDNLKPCCCANLKDCAVASVLHQRSEALVRVARVCAAEVAKATEAFETTAT